MPGVQLTAGFLKNPLAQGHNQTGLFCRRNKGTGQNKAPVFLVPAHQSLESSQISRRQMNNGLVIQQKLLIIQGCDQVAFPAADGSLPQSTYLPQKISNLDLPRALARYMAVVGIAQQVNRFMVKPGLGNGHTHADGAGQLLAIQY